jgi:hypothetical protein
MANDCYNKIFLKGDKSEVERLFSKAQGVDKNGEIISFTFNAFIPIPSTFFNNEREEYSWKIRNWGTKSDCYNVRIKDQLINFVTAWAPPFPIFDAISKQFPTLELNCFSEEPWMSIFEVFTLRAGKRI